MATIERHALEIIMPGMTHVLERNGKEAYVYFESGGAAHMLLDDGETRSGRWRMTDDGYVAEWNTGATGKWKLEYETGAVTYVNQVSAARVKMIGVLFGNPQGLPRQAG